MDNQDILLHYPYQKYDYIIRMIEQAAHDPNGEEHVNDLTQIMSSYDVSIFTLGQASSS